MYRSSMPSLLSLRSRAVPTTTGCLPRVMSHPLALLCLVLCFACTVLPTIATDVQVLGNTERFSGFPIYWASPTAFVDKVTLQGADKTFTTASIQYVMRTYPYGDTFTTVIGECEARIVYDDDSSTNMVIASSDFDDAYIVQFTPITGKPVKELYFLCDSMVLYLRDNKPRPYSLTIQTTLNINDVARPTLTFTMPIFPAQPYLSHTFMWSSYMPAHDVIDAVVDVKFTFFRSAIANQNDGMYIVENYPLLDLSAIRSLYPNPQSPLKDLEVPFNLHRLLQDGIVCKGDTNNNGVNQRVSIDLHRDITIAMTTTIAPQVDYSCSFTIQYPADVLSAIINQSKMLPNRFTAKLVTSTQEYPVAQITDPPTSVPARNALDDQDTEIVPPRVYIWTSPHHERSSTGFEFGIAMASQYYSKDGKLHIMPPTNPEIQSIQVTMHSYSSIGVMAFSSSKIECYQHTESYNDDPIKIVYAGFDIVHGLILALNHVGFHGLGMKCRVAYTMTDINDHPSTQMLIATIERILRTSVAHSKSITAFDAMHLQTTIDYLPRQFGHGESRNGIVIYTNDDLQTTLPPLINSVEMTKVVQNIHGPDGELVTMRSGTCVMDIHYLPSLSIMYDPHRAFNTYYLHLIFPTDTPISDLFLADGSQTRVTITTRSGYILYDGYIYPRQVQIASRFGPPLPAGDQDAAIVESGVIRHPSLVIPLYIPLDRTQPIRVSLQIPSYDALPSSHAVYPLVLPGYLSRMGVFRHDFATISPISPKPSSYAYRCVDWDNLAAPYMYKSSDAVPQLDDNNSFPCPASPPSVADVTTGDRWKMTKYVKWDTHRLTTTTQCLYELGAVCVVPSPTTPGAYLPRPLMDCPSLLGTTHALPCSSFDSAAPQWDYALDNANVVYSHASPSKPPLLHIDWIFKGDARVTFTVAVWASIIVPNVNDEVVPIILTRDVPAFSGTVITLSLPVPRFNPDTPVLNVYMSSSLSTIPTFFHPLLLTNPQHDCFDSENKTFDLKTHLCVCKPGFAANMPIGLDNPLVGHQEFTCTTLCGGDYVWNPVAGRCNCSEDDYSDVYCKVKKPNDSTISCHSIPKGTPPPFLTQRCGYGFSTYANGKCGDCECFGAWTKGMEDPQRCMQCKLESVCHPTQTDSITFRPEYCLVERCLCKAGYSGDKCQYAVMYGTLAYHDVATDEQKKNPALIAASKEHPVIVPRRLITTFQPRVTNNVKMSLGDTPMEAFVQQATQVLSDDGEEVITSIMVALGRLTDVSPSPSPFIMATTSASPFIPTADDNTDANDLSNLHYAWEQLQNNYQDRPVYKDDDYGTLNGGVGSAYDPHCVPNAYTYCPDGKEDDLLPPESQVDEDELKDVYEQEDPDNPIIDDGDGDSSSNTTTYIIIGVVLGVVLILFIALIVSILYCRKHGKMCFRKRKSQNTSSKTTSHHASSTAGLELTKASSHSSTPPSAPPSSTMSTSSYLPTQVAIADPTLPADWIALEDKSTGKIYYSNKVTMESSWDHPAQPKAKVAGAYGW